jgi:hypothetical protein
MLLKGKSGLVKVLDLRFVVYDSLYFRCNYDAYARHPAVAGVIDRHGLRRDMR